MNTFIHINQQTALTKKEGKLSHHTNLRFKLAASLAISKFVHCSTYMWNLERLETLLQFSSYSIVWLLLQFQKIVTKFFKWSCSPVFCLQYKICYFYKFNLHKSKYILCSTIWQQTKEHGSRHTLIQQLEIEQIVKRCGQRSTINLTQNQMLLTKLDWFAELLSEIQRRPHLNIDHSCCSCKLHIHEEQL